MHRKVNRWTSHGLCVMVHREYGEGSMIMGLDRRYVFCLWVFFSTGGDCSFSSDSDLHFRRAVAV